MGRLYLRSTLTHLQRILLPRPLQQLPDLLRPLVLIGHGQVEVVVIHFLHGIETERSGEQHSFPGSVPEGANRWRAALLIKYRVRGTTGNEAKERVPNSTVGLP